jgi:hypothetical protein
MARKIFLIIIVLTAVAGLAGIAISYFYGDKVKGIVISSINKKLNTPVDVKDISFSVFRNFPNASLVFEDVLIREQSLDADTLLYAKRISFLVGLSDLFKNDLVVKRIIAENSVWKLGIDKDGKNNFEIWKVDSTPGVNQGSFMLEQVLLKSARVRLQNDFKKLYFQVFIKEGNLKGAFSKQQFQLDSKADLEIGYFRSEGINYSNHKQAALQLAMNIDSKKYTIRSCNLKLDDMQFLVNGSLNSSPEGLMTDIHVSSPGSGPQALLSLFPRNKLSKAADFTYKGSVTFDMIIRGMLSRTKSPLVEIKFGASEVTITPVKGGEALKRVSFTGFYSNRKSDADPASVVSIKKFQASLQGNSLKGDIEITDFKMPFVRLNIKGAMNVALLPGFFKPDTLESIHGTIAADAFFSGKIGQLNTYKAGGTLELKGIGFQLRNKVIAFENFNGLFTLSGNDVEMQNFGGTLGTSDFLVQGSITNLYSWLLLPHQSLVVKAGVTSHELNLDELMEKTRSAQKDTVYTLHFSDKLSGEINLNVSHLHFQKFEARDLSGRILLADQLLKAESLRFNSMEGSLVISGSINAARNDSILISADAHVKNINITQLFYQMGNFGQAVVEDKNLKGKVMAEIQFVSTWSSNMICNTNKVYTNADITIENGELINFEPTQALSKYVKGADLRNIKFSTLKNRIEIKNRTIYFPTMEVKSSAMDITASGTHTFDNMVDYKIRLLLSQLLGKKVKEQNTEFGTIEDDGLGRTSIFLRMYGPMRNPKFSYDNKSVEEKIESDIKGEKQNLKKVLHDEFGWFKKDTSVVKKKEETPKKEEIEVDYGDEIEEK